MCQLVKFYAVDTPHIDVKCMMMSQHGKPCHITGPYSRMHQSPEDSPVDSTYNRTEMQKFDYYFIHGSLHKLLNKPSSSQ